MAVLADRYFVRVEIEMQMFLEEGSNGYEERFEFLTTCRDDHEVICVSDVAFDLECVLDELIELVEVDVCKELRREITDGNAFSSEEVGVLCHEALDDLPEERDGFLILQASSKNVEENIVIDRTEKLMDVALEDEAGSCAIAAHAA